LAGGGSTVEGVLEKDSIRPFVSPQADGKRGTLVVMADGSVRFISENISDDVFKALCTIQGGETDVIIDRDAPPVARPEGSEPPPPAQPAVAAPSTGGWQRFLGLLNFGGKPEIGMDVPPPTVPQPSQPKAASPRTDEWKEVTSQEGGFSISFPSKPQETKNGLILASPGHYEVTYQDMTEAMLKQQGVFETSQILDTLPQRVKSLRAGARLTGELKKITLDDNPGREFTLTLGGNRLLHYRIYVVKDRVYVLMAMNSEANVQRFFDSFKLLPK
jgi:hypothetical protein